MPGNHTADWVPQCGQGHVAQCIATNYHRQRIAIIFHNIVEANFDHNMIETVKEKPFVNNRVAFAVPYGAVWRE